MERDEKAVDLWFSFLTIPIAAIIKLLYKNSPIGCVDNLYRSAGNLSSGENCCIMSKHCEKILLSPELALIFGVKMRLLKIVDSITNPRPGKSWYSYEDIYKELEPKVTKHCHCIWGRVCKFFLVADDLDVALVSSFSTVHILNKFGLSISNVLVEKEVTIGETQIIYFGHLIIFLQELFSIPGVLLASVGFKSVESCVVL